MAVALDKRFFETLPNLDETQRDTADIAWLVYDLQPDTDGQRFQLSRHKTLYTTFAESLDQVTRPEAGNAGDFIRQLQARLDEKLENENAPETRTIEVTRVEC